VLGLPRVATAVAACLPALASAAPLATVLPVFVLEHISILVGASCSPLSVDGYSGS